MRGDYFVKENSEIYRLKYPPVFLEPRYSILLWSTNFFKARLIVMILLSNSSAKATALIPGEETIRLYIDFSVSFIVPFIVSFFWPDKSGQKNRPFRRKKRQSMCFSACCDPGGNTNIKFDKTEYNQMIFFLNIVNVW